jgi:tetratricopeptide (TPR) repeat protein
MEVLTKHVNEPPVPPRQKQPDAPISAAMEKLILHALEKEPSARPQTAEEFRRLLLAIPQKTASEPTAAHGSTPPPPATALAQPPPPPPPSGVSIPAPPQKGAQELITEPAQGVSRRNLFIGAAAAVLLALAAVVGLRGGKAAAPVADPPPQVTGGAGKITADTSPSPGTVAVEPKVTKDPAKAASLVEEASRLQKDGDTGAARDLLEQAVVLDPDNAGIHFRLATLYSSTKPQRAREEYQASIRLDEKKYGELARMALGALQ